MMAKKSVLNLNKGVKNLDILDIALTKFAVLFFVLAVITLFPVIFLYLLQVNPWIYAALFVIAAIRPFFRFFSN